MSRNVEYGVQREFNFHMGTNYCTPTGGSFIRFARRGKLFFLVLCSFAFIFTELLQFQRVLIACVACVAKYSFEVNRN